MLECFISGCKNGGHKGRAKKGVTWHAFPKDPEKIKAWLAATGQDFQDLGAVIQSILGDHDSFRLCSDHFAPGCYMEADGIRTLGGDAVPTHFPERSETRKPKNLDDLSDFDRGMIIGARHYSGLSVPKTAELLGFPRETVSRVSEEWLARQDNAAKDTDFTEKN